MKTGRKGTVFKSNKVDCFDVSLWRTSRPMHEILVVSLLPEMFKKFREISEEVNA